MFIEYREAAFVNTDNITYLILDQDGTAVIGLAGSEDVLIAEDEYADNLIATLLGDEDDEDTLDSLMEEWPSEDAFAEVSEDEDECECGCCEDFPVGPTDDEILDEIFGECADIISAKLPAYMGSMDILISVERD